MPAAPAALAPPGDGPAAVGDDLLTIPRRCVALASAFAPVRPLVRSGRLVSFNARLAVSRLGQEGGPFTVVAANVDSLARSLDDLLDAVEASSEEMARQGSVVGQRCREIKLLARAARELGEADDPERVTRDICRPGALERYAARLAGKDPGDPGRPVLAALARAAEALLGSLAALEIAAHDLRVRSDAVARLTEQQGAFLGISARIEAARLASLGTDLDATTQDITAFVQRVSVALEVARGRVLALDDSTRALRLGSHRPDRSERTGGAA